MNIDTCEIYVYTPDMLTRVLDVMSFLWKKNLQCREEYFKWKYADNPNTEDSLGIVALHKDRVIGFRGYFATRFEIPEKTKDLIVLVPGDTCVHPDYRRKGLSVLMGNLAMDTFSGAYKIFLNMTTTVPSLPGYLKMGFQPIAKKAYLSQYTFPRFIRYLLTYKKHPPLEKGRNVSGMFGQVILSERPKPKEMAEICAGEMIHNQRIRLLRDETFFRWRFENPFKRYRFYYFCHDSGIKGYVVIGLSHNHQRGYILDFADTDGRSVVFLLRHMIQNKHFDMLSIYHFSVSDEFREKLADMGFRASGLARRLEHKKTGELPVLIRPVRKSYTETDWKIEGLDIRNINNWQMTEICSDSV
jgi:GNAT superfamily N-acetyltransferase